MANRLVVDGRNFLNPGALRQAGFTYEAIGRPTVAAEDESGVVSTTRGA